MLAKLKEHDAEFRSVHLTIVDLIDEYGLLLTEQTSLDEHDDLVASLTIRIMTLVDSVTPASSRAVSKAELLSRR